MDPMPPAPPRWRHALPLVLLVLAAALALWALGDRLSLEALRDNRAALLAWRDANPMLAPALFVAAYVGAVAVSLPGAVWITLTGGFLFGLFPGTLYSIAGATLGALLLFLAVRAGFGHALRARIDASDGTVRRLSDGLSANEVPVLLGMRLMPVVPFFVANLIPAFLGVGAWRFVWTTALGILPGTAVYTWVGVGLGEVLARGEAPNLRIIFEPHVLAPLSALAALAFLPVAVRLVRGARA
jgi:uncharacterized membrane protein YdjX (TVP38/TMEM64 family)